MSKNIDIGTLFVKIGQNGEIQCSMIGRQPLNRAWPITRQPNEIALSNLDACGIIWARLTRNDTFCSDYYGPSNHFKGFN